MSRVIVWFSCGSCSTVALERAIKKYKDVIPVYCFVGRDEYSGEHIDNERYLKDVESLFNVKIIRLQSKKYLSPHDVYRKTGWINGTGGARCTVELKKRLRFEFQQPDDIQIFGYAYDEQDRQGIFNNAYPEVYTDYILNDEKLTKANCKGLVWKWGLTLPIMYQQGYNNNNCIGCVKGGKGYWNKIRIDFPETFNEMAKIEREIGATCIKEKIGEVTKQVYLDKLKPGTGNHKAENITCDFTCQTMEQA